MTPMTPSANVVLLEMPLNLLMLVFWFRIWTPDNPAFSMNPYISGLGRVSNRLIDFIRPVFFGLSIRWICSLSVVVLILFRALALPRGAWVVKLGLMGIRTDAGLAANLLVSVLWLAIFLFQLWGIAVIYLGWRRYAEGLHDGRDLLYRLAQPVAALPAAWRLPVVLLYGMLLLALVSLLAVGLDGLTSGPVLSLLAGLALSTLAAWVDVLPLLAGAVFVLVIGSWIATMGQSQKYGYICRDWLGLLMGPLSRRRLQVGALDFTPLVFSFVMHRFLHPFLRDGLARLVEHLP